MNLSPRAQQIIILIAEQPAGYPITLSAISEQLRLSRRTVQRALPEIRSFMEAQHYHFSAKTGTGLCLDESDEVRQSIISYLHDLAKSTVSSVSLQGRLLRALLENEEYLKISWLAHHFEVSEDTIEKELDIAGVWLSRYQVTLCRRAGIGVYLEQSEEAFRTAIEELIIEFYHTDFINQLVTPADPIEADGIANLISGTDMEKVLTLLESIQDKMASRLSDVGFIRLFICVALMLRRIRMDKNVTLSPQKMQQLQLLPKYALAEYMGDQLAELFSIPISSDEIGLLTMHLSNSGILPPKDLDRTEQSELNVLFLALRITEIVEQKLSVNLRTNDALINGLCNHLQSACVRLKLGSPIEHSHLADIRQAYPALFLATQSACQVLKEELDIPQVPDAEVAFIVMHFGAALEQMKTVQHMITAVVVCPTGVGISRLLAADLSRSYPQLAIRGTMSALRLDPDKLREDGVDLIISTIDLSVKYRTVMVNHILTERDRTLLSAVLDTISRQKENCIAAPAPHKNEVSWDSVAFIRRFSDELPRLSASILCEQAPILHNREELIHYAAGLFFTDASAQADIEEAFFKREQLGETYIPPFYALLLHCATPHVSHCRLGYIRLDPPYYEKGYAVLGAVVMLIPDDDVTDACAGLMSEVSALLLKQPDCLRFLRAGEMQKMTKILDKILLERYAAIVRQKIGN